MNKNLKNILAVSSLIVSVSASADYQNVRTYVLSPNKATLDGISYERALELFSKERLLDYGSPLEVKVDDKNGTADITDFDGWTVRVPVESAQSQPNKVDGAQ